MPAAEQLNIAEVTDFPTCIEPELSENLYKRYSEDSDRSVYQRRLSRDFDFRMWELSGPLLHTECLVMTDLYVQADWL